MMKIMPTKDPRISLLIPMTKTYLYSKKKKYTTTIPLQFKKKNKDQVSLFNL